MITDRDRLRTLVERLPDEEVHAALRFVEYLAVDVKLDLVAEALAKAEFDDEPLTAEDLADLAEAQEDLREGRTVSHAEAGRLFRETS